MPFRRFVEIGRVALVNYGNDAGNLCVIVDVISQNRVLVDGPHDITGVPRQSIPLRWLLLTDFEIHIPHSARQRTVSKAFKEANILEKWNKSSWASKIKRRELRMEMNDFDRFKVMVTRRKLSNAVTKQTTLMSRGKDKKR